MRMITTIRIREKSYSASENKVPVRSGDVITISAKGYEDLNLKFVVDKDGKASLVADDGKGDPLELHVKIEGSFEAAIVGQKDYDGVSGASTGGSRHRTTTATLPFTVHWLKKTKSRPTTIGKSLIITPKSISTAASARSASCRMSKAAPRKTQTVV